MGSQEDSILEQVLLGAAVVNHTMRSATFLIILHLHAEQDRRKSRHGFQVKCDYPASPWLVMYGRNLMNLVSRRPEQINPRA